jgi:hypothetical protein
VSEHKLRLFENSVLRRIFGPKREEVAGGSRRLHSDELHNLYASSNIVRVCKSRRVKWVGHLSRKGENKNTYKSLVGRSEGMTPLERSGTRRENDFRKDVKEMGWEGVDWINLVQDRKEWPAFLNTSMKLRFP